MSGIEPDLEVESKMEWPKSRHNPILAKAIELPEAVNAISYENMTLGQQQRGLRLTNGLCIETLDFGAPSGTSNDVLSVSL